MRIKALCGIAGIDYTFQKGGEYEVIDEIGNDLVNAGHAIRLKIDERATVQPIEKAKSKREGIKGN